MKRVVIIGASGFGGEVAWTLGRMAAATGGVEIVGFCDDAIQKRCGDWQGLPLLGPLEEVVCQGETWFHVAIGHNAIRERLMAQAVVRGWQPVTVIDPTAVVAISARIGSGCYVGSFG